MRSRFEAFRTGDASWLLRSWHPDTRPGSIDLTDNPVWRGLHIVDVVAGGPDASWGIVEFQATYRLPDAGVGVLHERSEFVRTAGRWYYLTGTDVQRQ